MDPIEICWWCGGVGDSRQHRVKASQLRKMFETADHLMLSGSEGERPTRLNGVKAKPMLFPKILCANCNNARSQPGSSILTGHARSYLPSDGLS